MSQPIRILIYEVVGSPLCVASGDGQRVHDRVVAVLRGGRSVILSFRNVTTVTSAFLNAAIGQLYGSFDESEIRSLLSVEEIEPDDRELLRRVIVTAKKYFESPERFNQAIDDELND